MDLLEMDIRAVARRVRLLHRRQVTPGMAYGPEDSEAYWEASRHLGWLLERHGGPVRLDDRTELWPNTDGDGPAFVHVPAIGDGPARRSEYRKQVGQLRRKHAERRASCPATRASGATGSGTT